MKSRSAVGASLSLAACFLIACPRDACASGDISLIDLNASFIVTTGTGFGNYSWRVNNTEGLFQQWFWYREGAMTQERPIDDVNSGLTIQRMEQTSPNTLEIEYASDRLSITTRHVLKGSPNAVPVSWLGVGVQLENKTDEVMDLHFYHYADFDLNGSPSGEVAEIVSPSYIWQTEGVSLITQLVSIPASHWELDYYSRTRDRLNDAYPTTLNDFAGPLPPGDATWALQWDFQLGPQESTRLQIDQRLAMPEPASLMLLAAGACVLFRRAR